MWVHATLVDTSLRVYTRYAGSLTIADKRRYYEEQKLDATLRPELPLVGDFPPARSARRRVRAAA